MQRGFDAGFPVGAQLGMRAGTILGVLEGIARGLDTRAGSGVVKKSTPAARGSPSSPSARDETRTVETDVSRRRAREQALALYHVAVKALDVQAVFTGFEARATRLGSAENKPGEKVGETAEAQLGRKGNGVVARWEERVAVPRWEENMEALEEKEMGGGSKTQGDKGSGGERS